MTDPKPKSELEQAHRKYLICETGRKIKGSVDYVDGHTDGKDWAIEWLLQQMESYRKHSSEKCKPCILMIKEARRLCGK